MSDKKKKKAPAKKAAPKKAAAKRPANPAHVSVTPTKAKPKNKKKKSTASASSAPEKVKTKARHLRKPNPGRMMQKEGGTVLLFGGVGMTAGLVGGQLFNKATPTLAKGWRMAAKGGLAVGAMAAALYWKPMQSVEAISGAAGLSFGLTASALLDQFGPALGLIPVTGDYAKAAEGMEGPDDDDADELDEAATAEFDAMVRNSMGTPTTASMQGLGDARPANMQGLGDARPANMAAMPDMQGAMGDLVATNRVPIGTGGDISSMQGRRPRRKHYGMGSPDA